MNRFILISIVIILPVLVSAQKLDELSVADHEEILLDWDNDVFVLKDFYYSQGLHLYWVSPVFKKNPINFILPRLKKSDNYAGIGVIQEMYTPKDIIDTVLNMVDRPYAGALFFRTFFTSSNPDKNLKLTSQFDLGFLGPRSGAAQAQKLIHEWTGSTPPQGWDFQVDDRPYINYNLLIEKGFISTPFFEFMGNSRVRAGTVHDDFRMGVALRAGKLSNYFMGLNSVNKAYRDQDGFQFALFGGLNLNVILYNATLMGGVIPPPITAQHLSFNEIENLVVDIHGGLQVSYKSVGLKGKLTWKSKEFAAAEQHGWGTIVLYFRL